MYTHACKMKVSPSFSSLLKVLCGTVKVTGSILQIPLLVVPEKALPPHLPSISISQLRDGSVQQSDGGPTIVMVGHPSYCVVNPVVVHVKKAIANFIGGWGVKGLGLVGLLDAHPHVGHVELVHDPLQGGPVGPQAIVVLANIQEDFVDGFHAGREELASDRVLWSVWYHFNVGMAVHVHGRHVVPLSGPRVEEL